MLRAGLLFFSQLVIFVIFVGPVFAAFVFMFPQKWLDKKGYFIDLPSFVLLLAAFLILGMGGGIRDFFAGYNHARKTSRDIKGIKKSLVSTTAFRKMIINWSIVGFLIGAVIMMANLDDMSSIFRGYSAAMISIYYGLAFIAIFCLPLEMRLKLRLAELSEV